MNIKLDSLSPERTFDIGNRLGQSLRGNELILIAGDLGAGKTLMTKGIAGALGIDPTDIVSPTFTLMNRYEGDLDGYVYHFDLYRLGEVKGQFMPELDEVVDEGLVVVEWAQFLSPQYFKGANVISIQIETSNQDLDWRGISIETNLEYIEI